MHKSTATPAPRPQRHSGDLTQPMPGFNAHLTCSPRWLGNEQNTCFTHVINED